MKTPKINIGKLLSQIDSFGDDSKRLAVAVTNMTADSIVTNAKQKAPVNYGQLRQSIGSTKATIQTNRSLIFANTPYAAYVEFGTGGKVSIPKGFEQLAGQFKGRGGGSFDSFLDNIRDWCRKKGIDEKLAYIIAINILKNGIQPQPYLIPSYLLGVNEYAEKLQKVLEKEAKKYNAKK